MTCNMTTEARHAHGYSGGTDIMGETNCFLIGFAVTNCFLIKFGVYSIGRNTCLLL